MDCSGCDLVYEITVQLITGKDISGLYKRKQLEINKINALDVMEAFHKVVSENHNIAIVKKAVVKALNIFHNPLRKNLFDTPEFPELFSNLIKQLDEVEEGLNELKPVIISLNSEPDEKEQRDLFLKGLLKVEKIYQFFQIMENEVFPLIESGFKYHGCIRIMWSVHDDIRKTLKKLNILFKNNFDLESFNYLSGKLFFDLKSIIFRNRMILFPVLMKYSDLNELDLFVKEPANDSDHSVPDGGFLGSGGVDKTDHGILVDLGTGRLTVDQIVLLFNNLPVEITFVDENDKVKYFSRTADPFFIRTKSIIGREVRNCHPPESVHIVDRIIKSFRSGERDNAEFRINSKY